MDTPKHNNTKSKKIALLLILIIGVTIINILFFYSKEKNTSIKLTGNVDVRETNLAFRVSGRILAMNKEEGDVIKKGDVIAKLDDAPFIVSYKAAQAETKIAEATFNNIKNIHNRSQKLFEKKMISSQDLEDIVANFNIAKEKLEKAKFTEEEKRINLEDTFLVAPKNGTILNKIRDNGEIIQLGQTVYTMSPDDFVWIRSYVEEKNLGKIYHGMQSFIVTDSGTSYNGTIGFISPKAEFTPKIVESESLRTELVYRIRIIVSNPDQKLKQGMPVTIYLKEKDNV